MLACAGVESSLARCSLVGFDGEVLFDKYVRQSRAVTGNCLFSVLVFISTLYTDYRTHVSGIRAGHLVHPSAIDFKQCQAAVAALIRGRVLVGHALQNDLAVAHSSRVCLLSPFS